MQDAPHYLRFARSLALVSVALATSACGQSTGSSCSMQGQACTIGQTSTAACCVCTAPSTEAGPPPDGGAGTWVSPCIGPLCPPELSA